MALEFVKITENDEAIVGSSHSFGAITVGLESFNSSFLVKNTAAESIDKLSVYLDVSDSYQGEHTSAEDLDEVLNLWPQQVSKEGNTCGLYLYKYSYTGSTGLYPKLDLSNWIRFGSLGSLLNPILLPNGCIHKGNGEDGNIASLSHAQLIFKFIVPDLNAYASVKSCRFNFNYYGD